MIKVRNDWDDYLQSRAITASLVVGEIYSMEGVEKFELVEWDIMSHSMSYKVDGKEEIFYNMRTEQILTIKKM